MGKVHDIVASLSEEERAEVASLLRRMNYNPRADDERFASIELMGHGEALGEVCEVEFSGVTWIEVTDDDGNKVLYNPRSVYSIRFIDKLPPVNYDDWFEEGMIPF